VSRAAATAAAALAAFAALGAVGAGPVPAAVEAQREMAVSLRVTPRVVPRGAFLTFTGSGWPARARVTLLVGPPASEADPVGAVLTDARGRFVRRIRIRPSAMPGRYVALACRRGCRVKATATFRII
jgi:hypothetical protein